MRPISSSVGKSSRWVVSGAGLAALACSYPGFSPDKLAWARIIPGSRPVAAPRQGSSPPLLWHASKGLAEERGQAPDPPLLDVRVRSRDGLTGDGLSSCSTSWPERNCWSSYRPPTGTAGLLPILSFARQSRVIGRGRGRGRERQRSLDCDEHYPAWPLTKPNSGNNASTLCNSTAVRYLPSGPPAVQAGSLR